jgi:hypothetical protein
MMKQPLTEHAAVRIRQRGVDRQALECLLAYGSSVHDHRGAEILLFDKRAWKRMERAVDGVTLKRAAESRRLYAVRSLDGKLVTVGHRHRRVLRN